MRWMRMESVRAGPDPASRKHRRATRYSPGLRMRVRMAAHAPSCPVRAGRQCMPACARLRRHIYAAPAAHRRSARMRNGVSGWGGARDSGPGLVRSEREELEALKDVEALIRARRRRRMDAARSGPVQSRRSEQATVATCVGTISSRVTASESRILTVRRSVRVDRPPFLHPSFLPPPPPPLSFLRRST